MYYFTIFLSIQKFVRPATGKLISTSCSSYDITNSIVQANRSENELMRFFEVYEHKYFNVKRKAKLPSKNRGLLRSLVINRSERITKQFRVFPLFKKLRNASAYFLWNVTLANQSVCTTSKILSIKIFRNWIKRTRSSGPPATVSMSKSN